MEGVLHRRGRRVVPGDEQDGRRRRQGLDVQVFDPSPEKGFVMLVSVA